MNAPAATRPASPRRSGRTRGGIGAGVAVLLAAAPVSAVVQGVTWFGHTATVVSLVVAVGLLLRRAHDATVAAAQGLAVAGLLTALFTHSGVLAVLPGAGALAKLDALLGGAVVQINTGVAPVPATPEILLVVTGAVGALAVAVYAAAVSAAAPAAAGVPLLAMFAVSAALSEDLLPWWAIAGPAAGFGLLLYSDGGAGRRLPAGGLLTATAVAVALLLGSAAGGVGTTGRVGPGSGGGAGGEIGLSPFTSLRGQLDQADPEELFRVRGLPRPAYLRALTLREYVPDAGWQAGRPDPGVPLDGPLPAIDGLPGSAGVDRVQVDAVIENVGFRDYWLPLYGSPIEVSGVAGDRWAYDAGSGTAYSVRPQQEDRWRQRALLAEPTLDQLRATGDSTGGRPGVDPAYLDIGGVDARVTELAVAVTGGASTDVDRALALVDFFNGPGSTFTYSLRTAPGGGDDALVEFLTVGRAGYCEQFASAMAVMLRTAGIPARVAVGFTGGTDSGGYRSVGTSDAHAWVEAWFPAAGWTTFDPTPLADGRALVPPYVQEARAAAGADPGTAERPSTGDLPNAAPDAPVPEPEALLAETEAPPVGPEPAGPPLPPLVAVAVLILGVVLLLGMAPASARMMVRRRRLATVAAGGRPAAAAAWAELLAESADRGVNITPSDTVRTSARRIVREHHLDAEVQQAFRRVIEVVESSGYGDGHPGAGKLTGDVAAVRAGIVAGRPITPRRWLLPPSLLGSQSAEPDTADR